MALIVPHQATAASPRMEVNREVLRVAERIQKGDGLMWEGDRAMGLYWNPVAEKYEVWRKAAGRHWLVLSEEPRRIDGICRRLAENDTRKVDVIGKMERDNARLEASRATALAEAQEAAVEFRRWAAKRLHLPEYD